MTFAPPTLVTLGSLATTYWISGGEVRAITCHHADEWPEHRAETILTAQEHGETLLGCLRDDFVGDVIETARHVSVPLSAIRR